MVQSRFSRSQGTRRHIAAVYEYRDARNRPVFRLVRYVPNDFAYRRKDGSPGLRKVPRLLYRLPELLAADKKAAVTV